MNSRSLKSNPSLRAARTQRNFSHIALASLALLAGLSQEALAQQEQRRSYIVQLKAEPAASYAGGLAGYAATQPKTGQILNFQAAEVQAYVGYLETQQSQAAALVSNAPIISTYKTVVNGFSARLTDSEVKTLLSSALVSDIQVDEPRQLQTFTTPNFLGLTAPGGLWSQSAGGSAIKGEDVVIGVIDSGIWPENPAFADRIDAEGTPTFSGGSLAYGAAPASWKGSCVASEGWDPAVNCNNKLIGAQFFNANFLGDGVTKLHWTEFNSARDSLGGGVGHGGHGTHTASTAGGNSGVPALVNGLVLGKVSGIAPRARIAMYKVCFTQDDGSSTGSNACSSADALAAIDKAVADGVNVINYSISGSRTSVNDVVEQAFFRAVNAGVFVAASAGNSGPANAVAHISPWVTTVAASSHDRNLVADLSLANGATYAGASMNASALPQAPLVLATDAVLAGADPAQADLCYGSADGSATLDPLKVAGKIVVCNRGITARVNKSLAVQQAGGLGMVLVDNGGAGGLFAEVHAVPSVHISASDGALVKTYASGGAGQAAISKFYAGVKPAPIMAGFSSRGPNMADGNLLKPDLTAPGVDILAGTAPGGTQATHDAIVAGTQAPLAAWESMQGTSMSSPHVAGLGALLKQAHPSWSPSAIKSALMTTTRTTLDDGLSAMQNGLLPWAQGAGHVVPNKATDPGLVYDAGKIDYTRYQCKVNKAAVPAADCSSYGVLDETYNLNQPAITLGTATGLLKVTRSVTNVSNSTSTYTASISVPGFTTSVSPSTLTLAPGETKSFTVSVSPSGAAEMVWSYGALTWTDGVHVVRSPVTLRTGRAIVAPDLISGSTASASRLFNIKTGFAGKLAAVKGGLKEASVSPTIALSPGGLTAMAFKAACVAGVDTASVKVHKISIDAGTLLARFELPGRECSASTDDFDLLLLKPDGTAMSSRNVAGADESIQLAMPPAGNYSVCVHAYAGSTAMSAKLSSWLINSSDTGGSFKAMLPSQVYVGGSASVGVSWTGLGAGKRYVGALQFMDTGGNPQAVTGVRVITNGGVPTSTGERELSAAQIE